jgi:FkbM family methyltransferase
MKSISSLKLLKMKKINLNLKKIGIPENFIFYTSEEDEGLSKELEEKGFREPHNSLYTYEFVDKNDVVLDIGANLGYFTLLCKNAKKIISVEPLPQAIPILKKNIDENHLGYKSVVINSAVGKNEGKLLLEVGNSFNSSRISDKENENTIRVNAISLHRLVKKYGANFIRIDVEGYEYEILLNNIPKKVNKISLEFHSHRLEKYKIRGLLNYFDKEGFKVKYLITFFPKRFEKYYKFFKLTHFEKFWVKIFRDLNMKETFNIINSYGSNFLIRLYAKYKLKKKRDCYLFLER